MEFRQGTMKNDTFPQLFIYNLKVITIIKIKMEMDKPSYSITCICRQERFDSFLKVLSKTNQANSVYMKIIKNLVYF